MSTEDFEVTPADVGTASVAEGVPGVPHPPGTATTEVTVNHPTTGEEHTIHVPADHDGSRIKVEFPEVRDEDGNVVTESASGYTEGFDPAERALAGERPVVPCGNCGAPQTLVSEKFTCSACGAENSIALRVASDQAEAKSGEPGLAQG